MEEFDIIGPSDKPALLAVSTPEVVAMVRNALVGLDYKVHVVENFEQFEQRYHQAIYQVVVIEETFAGSDMLENPALRLMQTMPMSHRRHAVIFLVGPSMETLNTMQAFAQSVHCVINYSELPMLSELAQKVVLETEMFLTTFVEAQRHAYKETA